MDQAARNKGFVASLVPLDTQALAPHITAFDRALAAKLHGSMRYLERGRNKRADPQLVLPGAQSILCVALPYNGRHNESLATGPLSATYARGEDYHAVIKEHLLEICTPLPKGTWKICVDTSAVMEKAWAEIAGIGWMGRHGLIITKNFGSYVYLAEVLLTMPCDKKPQPLPRLCGNCHKCETICPTQALSNGVLDARRCIAYCTLEDASSTEETYGWHAGCDLCQQVCPFNQKALKASPPPPAQLPWLMLLQETDGERRQRLSHSALGYVRDEHARKNLIQAARYAIQEGLFPMTEEALLALRRLSLHE